MLLMLISNVSCRQRISQCHRQSAKFSKTGSTAFIVIIIMDWRSRQRAWLFPRHSARRNDRPHADCYCMCWLAFWQALIKTCVYSMYVCRHAEWRPKLSGSRSALTVHIAKTGVATFFHGRRPSPRLIYAHRKFPHNRKMPN